MPVAPGHTAAVPVIVPGVDGILLTVTPKVLVGLFPQLLLAVTLIFPLTAEEPAATVIEFVVDVPVQPLGKVQVYEVAPLTGATL
jgi:hypothetical protein